MFLTSCIVRFAKSFIGFMAIMSFTLCIKPTFVQRSSLRIDDTGMFDGNWIESNLENDGMIVSFQVTGSAGMEWPKGLGTYVNFASGLWLAGKVNGDIRTSVVEYDSERLPGTFGSDPNDSENKIYKVNQHDFQDPSLNPDFQNWPVEDGAPWVDNNENGIYEPMPNGPDHPRVVGDQTLWFVSNDQSPDSHTIFGTLPLGIEVQTTIFGWDTSGAVGDIMFVKELIINSGTNIIDSMFISIWDDPDLGNAGDDFVGCDTLLNLGYCYNDGDDSEYGEAPPAIGYDFLQRPFVPSTGDTAIAFGRTIPDHKNLTMTSFSKYINTVDEVWSDPHTAPEMYNLMKGLMKNGDPLPIEVSGGSNYMHPGDPLQNIDITDDEYVDADTHPSGDRRFLMNSGPFTLAPGDSQEVIYAIIIGREQGNLESITKMKRADIYAQTIYENSFALPPLPSYEDFTSITDFTVYQDNLNDDGIVNNGEIIYLGIDITNTSDLTKTFFGYIVSNTPGLSAIESNGFQVDQLSAGSTYTLPMDNAPLLSVAPDFNHQTINLQVNIYYQDSTYWELNSVEIPVNLLSYEPDQTVYWGEHLEGYSNDHVGLRIIDPNQLTGHQYEISFSPDHYDQDGNLVDSLGINLFDMTTGDWLIEQHMLPGEYQFGFPVTDGFKLVVDAESPGINSVVETDQNGNILVEGVSILSLSLGTTGYLISNRAGEVNQPPYARDWDRFGYWEKDDLEIDFSDSSLTWDYISETVHFDSLDGSADYAPFAIYRHVVNNGEVIRLFGGFWDTDGDGTWNMPINTIDSSYSWLGPIYGAPSYEPIYAWQGYDASGNEISYDPANEAQYISDNSLLASANITWGGGTGEFVYPYVTAMLFTMYLDEATPPWGNDVWFFTNKFLDTLDVFQISTDSLNTSDISQIPMQYRLEQNFPNPFNPVTRIKYALPEQTHVSLTIYNLLGQEVISLINKSQIAGKYTILWNSHNKHGIPVSSGVYLYQIKTKSFTKTRKMVLLK